MEVTVFRTRERGQRRARPGPGLAGCLLLEPWPIGYDRTALRARLVFTHDRAYDVLPELLHARVRQITGSGIQIAGREMIPRRGTRKSSVDYFAQTWWCLVHTEEGRRALAQLA